MGIATGVMAEEARPAYGAGWDEGTGREGTGRRWIARETRWPDPPGGVKEPTPGAPAESESPAEPEAQTEAEPQPPPDPFQDADALEELGERITTLAAHLSAAERRFLALLAEFDRRRGWELEGHRSCAHWLIAYICLPINY